jgi:hypothetical protein
MLKTKGYSSFNLSFHNNQNGWVVTKSSIENAERLKKQCQKQKDFALYISEHEVLNRMFEVPTVIEETDSSFTMPFYNGSSIIDIIESGDHFQFESILTNLFIFIKQEAIDSELKEIKPDIFTTKLEEIKFKTKDAQVYSIIDKMNTPKQSLLIPVSKCHGDLTFSNCIFSNKIVLLDFLDCYIETFFQDLSKLLQEITLQWTVITYNKPIDKIKADLAYKKLLTIFFKKTDTLFGDFMFDSALVSLFYQITLLRILPYIKNEDIYQLIIIKLKETL